MAQRQKAVSDALRPPWPEGVCEPYDTSALLLWALPTSLVLPTLGPLCVTSQTPLPLGLSMGPFFPGPGGWLPEAILCLTASHPLPFA